MNTLPAHDGDGPEIIHGDCIEVMLGMGDNSVDAIVTDPPYGLGFMGKAWDDLPPGQDWAEECLRVLKPGGHLLAFGGTRTWHRLAVAVEDAGFEIRDSIAWLYGSGMPKNRALLKPCFEPIVMARKQIKGTLATNEVQYRTGALRIEDCRINPGSYVPDGGGSNRQWREMEGRTDRQVTTPTAAHTKGRYPANAMLDSYAGEALGGPSKFFYVAKPMKKERPRVGDTAHPTVKPLDLMRHLVRLATPLGGTVLDPFAGSGTTVEACILEGLHCIAIEREAEYLPLIQQRIERAA